MVISEGQTMAYDTDYCGVSSFGFGGTNAHCMAYGKNTFTSRAGRKNFRQAVLKKLEKASPPDIYKGSANPEEWESNGMPIGEENLGKEFQVEVTPSGDTIWRELVGVPPAEAGERFYMSGTCNEWG